MKTTLVLTLALSILTLQSCNSGTMHGKEQRKGKGGISYGGFFRYNEPEYLKSLFPLGITETVGHHIVTQVYEGLTTFNPADLTTQPCLGESWVVNQDGTVYTFKLRTGVHFHNDPCFKDGKGRLMTANDFVYSFNVLCTPDPRNSGFSFVRNIIKGANEYHQALEKHQPVTGGVEGVKAVNDSVLEIDLERPCPSFLQRLALPFMAVFPKEGLDYYKGDILYHTVGTGPFMMKALRQNQAVILVRNKDYWGKDQYGNQLPYLDGIKVSFIKDDKTEMMEFKHGNLDMKYRLPFDMIDDIFDDQKKLQGEYRQFVLQSKPELTTQFYGFLIPDKVFNNKNVRLAFNYAIDRAKIATYTAKGEGVPCFNGMVPLGIPGYDNSLVKGYSFDIAKAKEYLAKAGYPDGKRFPKVTLETNSGGGRNEKIAEAVQKMLIENLGVDVEIAQVVWAQHVNNIETGKVGFWRFAWVADYPDPENFLSLFYGKNVPADSNESSYANPFRYTNPDFDKIFEKAIAETDAVERNRLYAQLDQMVVDDAPFLPTYYSVNHRLIQSYVKNFPINGMEYRNFREVWLDNLLKETSY